jgi:peroxiredoxin
MRKSVLTLATLALVASPAFAGKYNTKVSVGDKAPTFSGIPASFKGEESSVSLPDIMEDVVVLIFVANHCPVVQACDDRVIDFAKAYQGKSVKVVGVAVTGGSQRKVDDLGAIKLKAKEKGFNYVYGFDETQQIGRDYGAVVTPQVFVLDKDRKIAYMGLIDDSPMNEAKVTKTYLKDAVDSLLAGKEVELKETKATGCGIPYDKK